MGETYAIISCDHGFGHMRRCALMATELEKQGHHVILFAPLDSFGRLQSAMPCVKGLTVRGLETRTTPNTLGGCFSRAIQWLEQLPNLDKFDNVVCDNLPEILACRSDVTISAQFFWHDVINGVSPEYVDFCNVLLKQHKPVVIGCAMFSMDSVKKQPNYKPVKLYKNPDLVAADKNIPRSMRTDLLVTGGTTPSARVRLLQVVDYLLKTGPAHYSVVHVDHELMPKSRPKWMLRADFSVEMYCRLKAAICRPGLGVVTDLLTVGATVFPVYESGNLEMTHNANMLRHYGGFNRTRGNMSFELEKFLARGSQ